MVQQWLFFQVGAIGPMLGQLWWFLHGSNSGNEEAITLYRKEALRIYGVVDQRLARSSYLASDTYSIADIAAFPWLRTHEEELALEHHTVQPCEALAGSYSGRGQRCRPHSLPLPVSVSELVP